MRRAGGGRFPIDFIACGFFVAGALAAIAWLPDSWAHTIRVASARATHIAVSAATSAESLTTALGVLLVVGAEVPIVGYRRSSLYRLLHPTKSTWTDITWFSVRVLGLGSLVTALFSLGVTVAVTRAAETYFGLGVLEHVGNRALHIFLYLFLADLLNYWVHRGRHQIRWWWEFHKLHHSATELNAITFARGHPLDDVSIVVVSAIPLALLGGSAGDSLIVLTILGVHAGITHSMLPWDWGWIGKYVIRSPIGHRIHHSPLPEHTDTNFALFPIWDRIFGTEYTGPVVNELPGVDANYYNARGLPYDVAESIRRAFVALRSNRKSDPRLDVAIDPSTGP
jgi:sterol desaturase/sphingolipid hydroxylase (fatty acid hydroxylase superfamily)